jgi:hypothetical protein
VSAILRIIDLGRCTAQAYFAASDVPALAPAPSPMLIMGIIDEDNLALGFNRRWANTVDHVPSSFSRARFTTAGGVMYMRNVAVLRLWTPREVADPFDLQSLLTNAAVDALVEHAGHPLPISYDTKYALHDERKFAGGSHNLINGLSAGLLMINHGPTDFSAVAHLFTTKRVRAVCDLASFDLGHRYYSRIFDLVAAAGEHTARPSWFTPDEEDCLARLRAAHAEPAWLGDDADLALFDCKVILEADQGPDERNNH